MNYLLKIENIIDQLINIDEIEAAREIKEIQLSASNSSELLMTVGFRLKQLLSENSNCRAISTDISELLSYCGSIGIKIR